jgi:hypothetical protein
VPDEPDCAAMARELVDSVRRSNAEFYERTGEPPSVSEAEYLAAEREIEAKLRRLAGLRHPIRSG